MSACLQMPPTRGALPSFRLSCMFDAGLLSRQKRGGRGKKVIPVEESEDDERERT
jgi:hypothetical protein